MIPDLTLERVEYQRRVVDAAREREQHRKARFRKSRRHPRAERIGRTAPLMPLAGWRIV
ncbi:MAG: hypothetical protein FWF90_07855 [Promicromonosporaceae bacterium]|nr:hypothetical protein [Promicromonosporaceae bacterium]